jgi:hypothetical protein
MSTPEETPEAAPLHVNKAVLLVSIKDALDKNLITSGEIYSFIGDTCGRSATDAQKAGVSDYHTINDECEIDDEAWASEADGGYWVHAWLWVPVETPDEPEDEEE